MSNKQEEIQSDPQPVGTEILDPQMPSNIDFQMSSQSQSPSAPSLPLAPSFDPNNLTLKSYSVKGHIIFSLPPQYPVGSMAPLTTHIFPIKDLNPKQRSNNLWKIWESMMGYVNRELAIDQGYIYVFVREGQTLRCTCLWRLVDLFKVFVDLQEFEVRLVMRTEGSKQLISSDFRSPQLKNILARLNEQLSSIGLALA